MVKIIDDIENADAVAMGQSIMHKIDDLLRLSVTSVVLPHNKHLKQFLKS